MTREAQKSSKEQESKLPINWAFATIGDVIIEMRNGITGRQSKDGEGFPVSRIETISDGTVNFERVGYLREVPKDKQEKFRLLEGDILFSNINSDFHLGKTALFGAERRFLLHGMNLLMLRTNRQIVLPRYLHYLCNYYRFAGRFISIAQHAVNQSSINQTKLKSLEFPLAPIAEQQRIVDEIAKQFSRLDYAVAALERLGANLKRYKAAVLKAACEGRLVPQDPDDEPAEVLLGRILAERRRKWEEQEWEKLVEKAKKKAAQAKRKAAGKPARISDLAAEEWQELLEAEYARYLPKNEKWKEKYKEPERPDTSELPELPAGWVWAKVDRLGDVRLGRQRSPKNHQGPHMRPYLRAANATWRGVDLSDVMEMNFEPRELDTYRLQRGDILLAEASGSQDEVGKPFVWNEEINDCCFQNTLIRVRLSEQSPDFLYIHFLKDAMTGRFGRISKGVGIHHLGAERLAAMPVAVPPIAEQKRIVAEVDRRLSISGAQDEILTLNLRRAERLRQAILQKAFSGQLVPQDPDDEPAGVLLEHIREERDKKDGEKRQRREAKTAQQPRLL